MDKRQHFGHSVPEIRKQEGNFAIVGSREQKAGTTFATRPGLLWWPQQLPWLRWLQHARHVTSGTVYVMWLALVNVLAHTCCVWYSHATLKVIYTVPRYVGGTEVKYCGITESNSWVRSTPVMYSGGSGFDSQYNYRKFWRSIFVVSLNTPVQITE